jgi:hypothetical protein
MKEGKEDVLFLKKNQKTFVYFGSGAFHDRGLDWQKFFGSFFKKEVLAILPLRARRGWPRSRP